MGFEVVSSNTKFLENLSDDPNSGTVKRTSSMVRSQNYRLRAIQKCYNWENEVKY